MIESWIINWKKNGWKTTTKKEVKNKDLWIELDKQILRHKVHWHWIKGHAGNKYNEKADLLARKYIEKLINGIVDIPSIPEEYKLKSEKKFLQAIVQVEYPQIFDFTFGTQVFGTYDINAKKIYGVGSPIFILSEYMLILSSSRTFNDDTIELNKFLMYNL